MIDRASVQLSVLRAGASLSMEYRVVAICCDWCGWLSVEDGAWTFGGLGSGLCHGNACCGERELSMKSNRVGTTDVLGMSCTLGSLMIL